MAEISRQMIGKLLEHTYLYDPCSVSPKTFQAKEVYLATFRRVQCNTSFTSKVNIAIPDCPIIKHTSLGSTKL